MTNDAARKAQPNHDELVIRHMDATQWAETSLEAKHRLVGWYRADGVNWPGTEEQHAAEFIAWLDEGMPSGHVI